MVAIAVGVLLGSPIAGCQPRNRANPPAGTASPAVEAVSPKGDVAWPFTFEWKASGGPRTVYRVTVYDAAERQLFEQDTRATRWDAPQGLQAFGPSDRTFQWRVAVLDDAGNVVVQTGLAGFTIR